TIQGPTLYVDNAFGGVFAVRDGITYGGGTLNVLGTPGGDVFNIVDAVNVTVDGVQKLVQTTALPFNALAISVVGDTADRIALSVSQFPNPRGGLRPSFLGTPTHGRYDFGSRVEVYGFGSVAAVATSASLSDSAGDDTLVSVAGHATLSGPGYSLDVSQFP